MSDTYIDEEQAEQQSQQESKDFKALRQKVAKLEEENRSLRGQALTNAIRIAGFDPDAGTTRLLIEKFDGDPDPDSFKEFAQGYGIVPNAEQVVAQQERTETEKQLAQLQGKEDSLRAASSQVEVKDLDGSIAEAEAEGDVRRSLALKAQKLRQLAHPN